VANERRFYIFTASQKVYFFKMNHIVQSFRLIILGWKINQIFQVPGLVAGEAKKLILNQVSRSVLGV